MIQRARLKPKGIIAIFSLLLIMLFIPTTLATDPNNTTLNPGGKDSETVSSDNSSNTGSDVNNGTGTTAKYGWSDIYVGYRVYVLDKYNQPKSEAKDIWFGEGKADTVVNVVSAFGNYKRVIRPGFISAKPSHKPAESFADGQMPHPWYGFSSSHEMLEGWIYAQYDEEANTMNGKQLVIELFGEDVWKGWVEEEDNEYYLVLEGITMFDVYSEENDFQGETFAGSAYNWGIYCAARDWRAGGAELRRGTNGIFATSQTMEYDWLNKYENLALTTKTVSKNASPNNINEWITTDLICQQGYDTTAYTFTSLDTAMTHTWDYPLGNNPGPAPKVPEKDEGKVTIVKVYCTKNSETGEVISWDGSYIRTQNPRMITIEDEEDYKVEEWLTSTIKPISAPSTWPPIQGWPKVQGPSGGTGTVELQPDPPTKEVTLAVLLSRQEEVEEVPSELIIEESEISIYRTMSDVTDFNQPNPKIQWTATDKIDLSIRCPETETHTGHRSHEEVGCTDPECTSSHSYSYEVPCNGVFVMKDTQVYLKVKNQSLSSYAHVLATGSGSAFKPKIIPYPLNGYKVTVTSRAPGPQNKSFDYEFIAYRGRTSSGGKKDDLTLSNYTVSGEPISFNNGTVKSLGEGYQESNKTTKIRWAQEEKGSIETKVPLQIQLVPDTSGIYKFSGRYNCDHGYDEGKFTTTEKILANGTVTIHSYAGKQKSMAKASASPISSVQGCFKGNGYPVKDENLVLSFYPYIHMTYETMGSNEKKDAAVLSQFKRSMTVNDYAEAGYKSGGQTLVLKSQQWSIHQMATKPTEERPWAAQNTVLPGGAIYNVSNGSTGGNQLILRTYQVVVDDQMTQFQAAGSTGLENHTMAVAKAKHEEFVNKAVVVFNNGYYIEQVINENPLATLNDLDGGTWSTVNSGDPGLSKESKYYLYTDATSKVQSSLLQASGGAPSYVTYTFRSDTAGNIYMNGSLILKKDQSANELTNAKAKYINARTKVVSNFIGAIERNTGEDFTASWATEDGAWYNEAFSITILEATSIVNVGISDTPKRETVLDPALCPDNLGKSDYFSKAISSAYRMSSESLVALDMGKGGGYVSTFREQDVVISNITGMFRSNVFRIPNVNVQDLKD